MSIYGTGLGSGVFTTQFGLISGLDFGSIIDKLIAIVQRPADQVQLSGYPGKRCRKGRFLGVWVFPIE